MVRYTNGGLKNWLKKLFYGPKCPVFEWSAKSSDFTIWIQDTYTVMYSDKSGNKVLGIQMVTVITSSPLASESSSDGSELLFSTNSESELLEVLCSFFPSLQ